MCYAISIYRNETSWCTQKLALLADVVTALALITIGFLIETGALSGASISLIYVLPLSGSLILCVDWIAYCMTVCRDKILEVESSEEVFEIPDAMSFDDEPTQVARERRLQSWVPHFRQARMRLEEKMDVGGMEPEVLHKICTLAFAIKKKCASEELVDQVVRGEKIAELEEEVGRFTTEYRADFNHLMQKAYSDTP